MLRQNGCVSVGASRGLGFWRRIVMALVLAALLVPASAWARVSDVPLSSLQFAEPSAPPVPGLHVGSEWRGTPAGPVLIHYVAIDPAYGLRLRPVIGVRDAPPSAGVAFIRGVETVSEMARRTGALAALNGTYFDFTGLSLGLLIIDGEWVAQPMHRRTALGWDDRGRWVMEQVDFVGEVRWSGGRVKIDGYNRPRRPGEVVVYTPTFGRPRTPNQAGWEWVIREGRVAEAGRAGMAVPSDGWVLSAQGGVVEAFLPLRIGDEVEGSWTLVPDWLESGIVHAIGGGPRLLRGGRINITAEEEQFGSDIRLGRAPRSAIGLTQDGRVLLVAVSGRRAGISIGVTLEELAAILQQLGAVEAMNLDGGGSTTLVVGQQVINLPSGGAERPVGNSLAVLADSPHSGRFREGTGGSSER